MRTPHADAAIVTREKIVGYLLNPLHPDSAGKAWFFTRAGYRVDEWQVFARALQDLVAGCDVKHFVDSVHGTKYIVDGLLNPPVGRPIHVRTVWIVDDGEQVPRLITAYPQALEQES